MELGSISIIIGALLAVSEALALIPNVKANGVFQVVWNLIKILAGPKKEE